MREPDDVVGIEAVKYYWREWYTKVTEHGGRIWHYPPLNSEWAARQLAQILRRIYTYEGRMHDQKDGAGKRRKR